ncbi:glycosyltransferase [Prauserella shujinwangii]|uniref:Glycosyltransferase n=2 Tax=Prauserella shujinwangii TaxID=1453103 RepID=A0A2T0M3V8_9PSEU|nr:glycosyltransferase [Prauserella shujinwangii]
MGVPEGFADTVRSSGLPMAPTSGPFHMADVMAHDRSGTPIQRPTDDEEMTVAVGLGFGRLAARVVDGVCALVERWRPDVVLSESYSYAAAAAAAAVHGVPWVKQTAGPGELPIAKWVAQEFAPELERLGIAELPEADLFIDNSPPLFRSPTSTGVPMRYVPYGDPDPVPSWVLEPRVRPRVLVTLGSIQPAVGDLSTMADIVRTLSAEDVEIVVAVDDSLVERLGPLPESVLAAGWLSLTSVLPGCDLVIHHGGPGTLLASVAHGLPQVIIPGPGKAHDAVRDLVGFGAAVRLPPTEVTPGSVAAACRTVLTDPGFRARAGETRAQLAEQPSPAEVVPALERLAR